MPCCAFSSPNQCSTVNIPYLSYGPYRLEKLVAHDQLFGAVNVSVKIAWTQLSAITLSPPILKEKCIGDVMRIGSIIIFHVSKLWIDKFFILCVVIFMSYLPLQCVLVLPGPWSHYCILFEPLLRRCLVLEDFDFSSAYDVFPWRIPSVAFSRITVYGQMNGRGCLTFDSQVMKVHSPNLLKINV